MDAISSLVRDIAVIVVLASFMEMLLPNSSMKRFVQVVLGLFIIITILTPITSIFDEDLNEQVSAWQFHVEGEQTDKILAQGKELSKTSTQEAIRGYEERMEKQIKGLVILIPGVSYAKVDVLVEEITSGGFGGISNVHILASTGEEFQKEQSNEISEAIESIEPIEIEIGEKNEDKVSTESSESSKEEVKRDIIKLVSNFYGMSAEKIYVEVKN